MGDGMRCVRIALYTYVLGVGLAGWAAVVGSVRGIIHDPQHRPVADAMVMIKAKNSDWAATMKSDEHGVLVFNAVARGALTGGFARRGFEQAPYEGMVGARAR